MPSAGRHHYKNNNEIHTREISPYRLSHRHTIIAAPVGYTVHGTLFKSATKLAKVIVSVRIGEGGACILTSVDEHLCLSSDTYLSTLLQVEANEPDATNGRALPGLVLHGGRGIVRPRVDVNRLERLVVFQLTNQNPYF